MPIVISRTSELKTPSLVICVYAAGGVGKSTLAATSPKPIFLDAENGTKAFGIRGIDVPLISIKSWFDVQEAWAEILKHKEFETVVIDPVGSFLDLLIEHTKAGGSMNVQKWTDAKDKMRKFIQTVKDSGRHVVFVAHEKEDHDDDQVLHRPLLSANLWNELVNMCDVVGHLRIDAKGERTMQVQPEPKYYAKDRFAIFDSLIKNPNISEMVVKLHSKFKEKEDGSKKV